ncbi:MAG: response regulator [Planctomycetota bacterium]
MSTPIRVLLIEDDACDAAIVSRALSRGNEAIEVTHVADLHGGISALDRKRFHAIILDLGLPDSDGLDGVARLVAHEQQLPIIVMTGNDDPALALEGISVGAEEFLEKGKIYPKMLVRVVRHAVARWVRPVRSAAMCHQKASSDYSTSSAALGST